MNGFGSDARASRADSSRTRCWPQADAGLLLAELLRIDFEQAPQPDRALRSQLGQRRKEANNMRSRIDNCENTIALAAQLRDLLERDGPLPVNRALEIALDIADGQRACNRDHAHKGDASDAGGVAAGALPHRLGDCGAMTAQFGQRLTAR